jgi:hypothetical protein
MPASYKKIKMVLTGTVKNYSREMQNVAATKRQKDEYKKISVLCQMLWLHPGFFL